MRRFLLLCMVAALSCSGYRPARFVQRPPVINARDDQPIAPPRWRGVPEPVYVSEVYLHRPLRETLDLDPYPDARDVNSFDDVVHSSWFDPQRIDVGAMARGPDTSGPPRPPFTVLPDGAMAFASGGFCISDSRGQRYEIMVDPKDRPEMSTAAAAVAARLVWAFGYNTPPVFIAKVTAEDFWRSEGSATDVTAILKSGPPPVNGYYRVAALSWPSGLLLGRTPESGVRGDDSNDLVIHEDRRVLRALTVVASWLLLDGLGPSKTLDRYVGAPSEGHVVHYVAGLDDALGAGRVVRVSDLPPGVGGGSSLIRLLTLGLAPNPAPPPTQIAIPSLGQLEVDLDPGAFQPPMPWEPALRLLAPDGYWAVKRIAAISSAQIALAIDAGQLADQRARRAMQVALERRRARVLAYWLARVVPLEPVALTGNRLLLRDEAVALGVAQSNFTDYRIEFLTSQGGAAADAILMHPTGGTLELVLPDGAVEAARDYVVVQIAARRGGRGLPRTFELHLKIVGGKLVVLGIRH
jgi:hypothetical protein